MFRVPERTPRHAESARASAGFEVAGGRVTALGALSTRQRDNEANLIMFPYLPTNSGASRWGSEDSETSGAAGRRR